MKQANTPIEDIINLMTPDEILTTNANWLCQQYQRNGYILSKTTRKKIHKALDVARKAVLRAKSTKHTSAPQSVTANVPQTVVTQPKVEEKTPYQVFAEFISTIPVEQLHEVELNELASTLTKQGYDFEDEQMLHKLGQALAAAQFRTPKPVMKQVVEEKQMSIENRVRQIYLDMGPESADLFTLDDLLIQLRAEGYSVEAKSVVERVITAIRACRPDPVSNRNQREQTRQQRVTAILETMSLEQLQTFNLMDTRHSSWQTLHRQLRFEGWRLTLKAQYEIIDLIKDQIFRLQHAVAEVNVQNVKPVIEPEPSHKEEAVLATPVPQKETPVEQSISQMDFSQVVEHAFVLCNGDIDLLEEKINTEIATLRRFCSLLKKF